MTNGHRHKSRPRPRPRPSPREDRPAVRQTSASLIVLLAPLQQPEPLHNDRFGLPELPAGVSCIATHQVDDLGPERKVGRRQSVASAKPSPSSLATWSSTRCSGVMVTRVVSTAPWTRRAWSTRFKRSPTRGSGSPDRYSTAREDVAVFSPRSTAANSRSPNPPSPFPEAQALHHAPKGRRCLNGRR